MRKTQGAPIQQVVSLAIDRDVLDRFRATGPDWKKRMNAIPHEAAEDLPTA
ncbi:BrnA antitoxin family protein [Methylobacterium durans]|uniref:BrnA antitoxin family protein n=1 Tax=Methylobacterium durans TaxID=2202825 RepID=UPI002AFE59DD|nr:BrnA antitoxin family protein [Methylobacterium durans]MEA1831334.1 BrnA antitoxin family protein [Methylobacterium durans]